MLEDRTWRGGRLWRRDARWSYGVRRTEGRGEGWDVNKATAEELQERCHYEGRTVSCRETQSFRRHKSSCHKWDRIQWVNRGLTAAFDSGFDLYKM
jgi:hypothetical protein